MGAAQALGMGIANELPLPVGGLSSPSKSLVLRQSRFFFAVRFFLIPFDFGFATIVGKTLVGGLRSLSFFLAGAFFLTIPSTKNVGRKKFGYMSASRNLLSL